MSYLTSMCHQDTYFFVVSSAVPSARWTMVPGWTISSASSSSSSSSHLAWGTAPQPRPPTSQGHFSSTDCQRSDGSRCLQKSRCISVYQASRTSKLFKDLIPSQSSSSYRTSCLCINVLVNGKISQMQLWCPLVSTGENDKYHADWVKLDLDYILISPWT